MGPRAAILLDVCGVVGGRGGGEIPPADPFLLPRFLEGAMAALEPGGVLAIHVANPNKEEALQAVASIARPRGLAVRSLALRGEGGVGSDPWLVYACPPHSPKTAEEFAKQLQDGPLRGLCPANHGAAAVHARLLLGSNRLILQSCITQEITWIVEKTRLWSWSPTSDIRMMTAVPTVGYAGKPLSAFGSLAKKSRTCCSLFSCLTVCAMPSSFNKNCS